VDLAIVVPARMASTRFPGKPLVDLLGKPMIQWVIEAARAAGITDQVIVATPDPEIAEACRRFDTEAILTSADHPSGTDRIAEVALLRPADIFVNVQGDEPLIRSETIRACAGPLMADRTVEMGSVYSECTEREVDSPDVVKVVTDVDGFALYFSRCPIPYPRHGRTGAVKKHVGIYACTGQVLARFREWRMGELEQAESLEQLRFLENGVRIKMSHGAGTEVAVDTPEQAQEVRRLLAARS